MIIFSICVSVMSVLIGLFTSLELDTPSGPSIIVASLSSIYNIFISI